MMRKVWEGKIRASGCLSRKQAVADDVRQIILARDMVEGMAHGLEYERSRAWPLIVALDFSAWLTKYVIIAWMPETLPIACVVHPHQQIGHVIERSERLACMLTLHTSRVSDLILSKVPCKLIQSHGLDEMLVVVEVPRGEGQVSLEELGLRVQALMIIGAKLMSLHEAVSQIAAEYGDERCGADLNYSKGYVMVPAVPRTAVNPTVQQQEAAQMTMREWHQVGEQIWRGMWLEPQANISAIVASFTPLAGVRLHWQVVPGGMVDVFQKSTKGPRVAGIGQIDAACYMEIWSRVWDDNEQIKQTLASNAEHIHLLAGEHAFAATRAVSGYLTPSSHLRPWSCDMLAHAFTGKNEQGPLGSPLPPTAASA